MRARGIIGPFLIFRVFFQIARIFDKSLVHDAYRVK